ncbi:MAG: T9SS type A sorting domain-containing protein [Flavobacteriales bacterium]|nr:T9SS type A sorting domain-containing protein [Flavobacteriales bacterium]MBP6696203.1 T9SS type A sorting domain-containing protein [Flavobacteriales bacterium]
MRNTTLLLSLCGASGLFAQNWALINPAYKYNYSLGGTDTITNQIFATQVDTLGPDSFRYSTNLVVEPCDTCELGSLGIPCDFCYWKDRPQFLQRTMTRSANGWWMDDPRHLYIRPAAPTGTSWWFEPMEAISATIISTQADTLWGVPDSIKIISCSNGDTIITSRSFGLLRWERGPLSRWDLIGLHGPDLGRLIPTFNSMCSLLPGDQVEYRYYNGWFDPGQYSESLEERFKLIISGPPTPVPDGIVFPTSCLGYSTWASHWFNGPWDIDTESIDLYEWPFSISGQLSASILNSYPGQFMVPDGQDSLNDLDFSLIAQHGLDSAGNYVIRSQSRYQTLQGNWWSVIYQTDIPDLIALYGGYEGVEYNASVGLVSYWNNGVESEHSMYLQGALINGDTLGVLSPDSLLIPTSVEEIGTRSFITVQPNPADAELTIRTEGTPIWDWIILDASGRALLRGQPDQGTSGISIPVPRLAPGPYMIEVRTAIGWFRERFIIAR